MGYMVTLNPTLPLRKYVLFCGVLGHGHIFSLARFVFRAEFHILATSKVMTVGTHGDFKELPH